jgi:alkanesulfonate monooxygenase SsuD/methylene tetrahydromethanopterin reductase-like flavin-dependent oxidoreductase (luciferase family)
MLFNVEGSVNFEGHYYKLKNAYFSPPCTQKPHIPIMVGGNGEKRTLRTLAKFGDIANIDLNKPGGTPEMFKHKIEVLERHCEEFGRDSSKIKKTMVIPLRIFDDEKEAAEYRKTRGASWLYGTIPFIIDRIQQYIDVGVEEIIFSGIQSKVEMFKKVEQEILSAFS